MQSDGEEDVVVPGVYCDFLSLEDKTITNITGAILKLLVGGGGIPGCLRDTFQKSKTEFGDRGLLLADLIGMLRGAINLPRYREFSYDMS